MGFSIRVLRYHLSALLGCALARAPASGRLLLTATLALHTASNYCTACTRQPAGGRAREARALGGGAPSATNNADHSPPTNPPARSSAQSHPPLPASPESRRCPGWPRWRAPPRERRHRSP